MDAQSTGIGDRVRSIRKRRGLTQHELAACAGLSLSLVKKVEQGTYPSMRGEMARKLAVGLGVTVTDILAGQHDAPVPEPDSAERWEPVQLALEGQHGDQAEGEVTVDGLKAEFVGALPLHKDGRFAELGVLLPPLLRDVDSILNLGRSANVCAVLSATETAWVSGRSQGGMVWVGHTTGLDAAKAGAALLGWRSRERQDLCAEVAPHHWIFSEDQPGSAGPCIITG